VHFTGCYSVVVAVELAVHQVTLVAMVLVIMAWAAATIMLDISIQKVPPILSGELWEAASLELVAPTYIVIRLLD